MKVGRSIDEFRVGMKVEFSRRFTRQDVEDMARLTGDHNPFHHDGPFVRGTRFRRPIVHGLLVGGMICHFGGDLFPGPGYLAEEMHFRFLKPVYFNEEIRAIGTVTAVDRERRRVSFSMSCYNEKGEKVLEGMVVGIPFQVEVPGVLASHDGGEVNEQDQENGCLQTCPGGGIPGPAPESQEREHRG